MLTHKVNWGNGGKANFELLKLKKSASACFFSMLDNRFQSAYPAIILASEGYWEALSERETVEWQPSEDAGSGSNRCRIGPKDDFCGKIDFHHHRQVYAP
jgi:hypothetical protein